VRDDDWKGLPERQPLPMSKPATDLAQAASARRRAGAESPREVGVAGQAGGRKGVSGRHPSATRASAGRRKRDLTRGHAPALSGQGPHRSAGATPVADLKPRRRIRWPRAGRRVGTHEVPGSGRAAERSNGRRRPDRTARRGRSYVPPPGQRHGSAGEAGSFAGCAGPRHTGRQHTRPRRGARPSSRRGWTPSLALTFGSV